MSNYFKKRFASFGYAFQGIATLFREEPNAVIHLLITVVAIVLGFFLKISLGEWLAIIICIGLVLSMEALNTAIENLSDFSTKEKHPIIKKAKDLAAAAVFICAMASLTVGIIIFLPKLIALL
ncbi:MAG: diacylglycerol kinase family protein [Dysgonamonadaceae bacterium]|jgi:diacylglycerol kinase|nr:diacylglycerol kinase family protein [Dysgonamonadaceae bacterium]